MEKKLDNLFYEIRNSIYHLINKKNININELSNKLGVNSRKFISNFSNRIDDFTFYLQTLDLLESWDKYDIN